MTKLAEHLARAGDHAGAEVRLRHVAETRDPQSFASNPAWSANYEATPEVAVAGKLAGSPTVADAGQP